MSTDKNVFSDDDAHITELVKAKEALKLQRAVLKTMAELVEFRDGVTGGHIERTRGYLGVLLGALMKKGIYADEVDTWDIWLVLNSAQLHDIGKIAIKDSILRNAEKLSEEEFEEVKSHATFGESIIEKIEKGSDEQEFLHYAKILAATHHEKWDGSGYPRGLKGYEIPLLGRLMAIADVYDALISVRPYKKAFSHYKAVEIIREGSGIQFEPALVDVFLEVSDDFDKIAKDYELSQGEIDMKIDKIQTGEKTVLKIGGRLDSFTASEFQKTLINGFDDARHVELDCDELIYISSAGVRAMLSAEQRAEEAGGSFSLVNVCDEIMEVFDMTGFSDILNITRR
ncbi:MAG: anti-sigma factor antagonist [Oscillospiraceae bacterium]|nr:anti-sigma factor antagonist [Oscillospiraceae bacterium]